MTEEKLISPLLDGFLMGGPISDHDGTRCCPAMKEGSEQKYIVKIISVPGSQKQLDALLLAGAYRKPEEAMKYFRQQADEVTGEAELLKELSLSGDFLSYEDWQVEPMSRHDVGYLVYLLSPYRKTLEKHMRRTMLTHLDAMNLSLDLCKALADVRSAGYIYADLKPTNIFLEDGKACKIGDLGFIPLKAFRYTAMPQKYLSAYTPRELRDPMAELNQTLDTYALGMVLYQIYNDGQLPEEPEEGQGFASPVNADYELAEIILKALSPKPEDRFQDPQALEQAITAYMQRNSINDEPVTPPSTVIYDPEDTVELDAEAIAAAAAKAARKESGEDTSPAEVPSASDGSEVPAPEEVPVSAGEAPEVQAEPADAPEATEPEATEPEATEPEATVPAAAEPETAEPEEAEPEEAAETPVQPPQDPQVLEIQQELDRAPADETMPTEQDAPAPEEAVPLTDEASAMMAQADALLAEEVPSGVELPQDPFAEFLQNEEDWTTMSLPPVEQFLGDPMQEETKDPDFPERKDHKVLKTLLKILIVLLILVSLGFTCYYYYANSYVQTIDSLVVEGNQTGLTVKVQSDIPEQQLTVACIDAYGNALRQPLVSGQAQFIDLLPDSMYEIQLEMEGRHKLVGQTNAIFTTDARTTIVTFEAVSGMEEGSVQLDFTVDGPEPAEWTLVCAAESEEPREIVFSGHSVLVKDLTMGKTYTFHLQTDGDTQVVGDNRVVEFAVSQIVLAENVVINAQGADGLQITWDAPADTEVSSWKVHCFNDEGYDQVVTVTGTEALVSGIDLSHAYTVEVTAEGMTQSARATISANPVTISEITVDDSQSGQITVSWEYNGEAPADGWLLSYGMDTTELQNVVSCKTASGVIAPVIPGVRYHLAVQTSDGASIFNNVYDYEAPAAREFNDFSLSAAHISAKLLKTPEDADWNASKLSGKSYKTTFLPGDSISMVLHADQNFYLPNEPITLLYVLRDNEGRILSKMITKEDLDWSDMWFDADYHDAELDLPVVPSNEGSYNITVYGNGAYMASADFKIEKQ